MESNNGLFLDFIFGQLPAEIRTSLEREWDRRGGDQERRGRIGEALVACLIDRSKWNAEIVRAASGAKSPDFHCRHDDGREVDIEVAEIDGQQYRWHQMGKMVIPCTIEKRITDAIRTRCGKREGGSYKIILNPKPRRCWWVSNSEFDLNQNIEKVAEEFCRFLKEKETGRLGEDAAEWFACSYGNEEPHRSRYLAGNRESLISEIEIAMNRSSDGILILPKPIDGEAYGIRSLGDRMLEVLKEKAEGGQLGNRDGCVVVVVSGAYDPAFMVEANFAVLGRPAFQFFKPDADGRCIDPKLSFTPHTGFIDEVDTLRFNLAGIAIAWAPREPWHVPSEDSEGFCGVWGRGYEDLIRGMGNFHALLIADYRRWLKP